MMEPLPTLLMTLGPSGATVANWERSAPWSKLSREEELLS